MRALPWLLLLAACDRSPPASNDPWAGSPSPAAPAADPWASNAPAATPSTGTPSTGTPSTGTPSAAPAPERASGALDGTWSCSFLSSSWMNGMRFTQPVSMNGFTISGGDYTSAGGSGTVVQDGPYVEFHGAGWDGWRGAMNAHSDGSPYMVFHGPTHRDATAGDGARLSDVSCELRR